MSRLNIVNPETATDAQKVLFSAVKGVFGGIPNLFRVAGNSPAALEGMFGFFSSMGKASISVQLREQIALAVAQRNECAYCLAAHTAISQGAGIKPDVIAKARAARSDDAQEGAALAFAVSLVDKRGKISAEEIALLRRANFNDAEIVEIIAAVVFNVFTNYLNIAADVDIDFPAVPLNTPA